MCISRVLRFQWCHNVFYILSGASGGTLSSACDGMCRPMDPALHDFWFLKNGHSGSSGTHRRRYQTGPAVGAYVGVSVGTYLLVHCGSRVLRCTVPAGGANSCVLGRQFSSTLRLRRVYDTAECWRSRRGNDVPSLVSEDKVRVWWQ